MCTVDMVSIVERLERKGSEDIESMIHFEEKEKTNEATLTEFEVRSFGILMLPRVRQCMCIFYSSYYHAAVAIFIAHMMAICT